MKKMYRILLVCLIGLLLCACQKKIEADSVEVLPYDKDPRELYRNRNKIFIR